MKRKNFYFLLIALIAMNAYAAEDTTAYKKLIISEVHSGAAGATINYFEFCNMSDDTMDLSDYFIQTSWNNIISGPISGPNNMKLVLEGTLAPEKPT